MKFHSNQTIRIAASGVAAIAAVAFAISYVALKETAAANGFTGWQSWLWPLLIDLPILVFAFAALTIEQLTGQRSWFATAMIVFFSAATLGFNLVHSEVGMVNYAVAAMPPLALIVSFEMLQLLMRIVAQQQQPATVEDTRPVEMIAAGPPAHEVEPDVKRTGHGPLDPVHDEAVEVEPVPPAAPSQTDNTWKNKKWKDMTDGQKDAAIRDTMGLSQRAAAEKLGCTQSTVFRARKSLQPANLKNRPPVTELAGAV